MHERPGFPHFLCTFSHAAKTSFIRNHLELSKAENRSAISHLQTSTTKYKGWGGVTSRYGGWLFVSI